MQNLDASDAVALAEQSNNMLAATIAGRPDRFGGMATLPTPDPQAAARELERAVTQLGLDGAMIFGRTRDRTMDAAEFWPIYEVAAELRAPLHLHPQSPPPAVRAAYYTGFGAGLDSGLATHGIGWHYESGIEVLRLILAGVFDRFPELQVIVGHWGELVLFYLDRISSLDGMTTLQRPIADYFKSNVYIAPSSILSPRYLQWAMDLVGVDRIMFSTDYPFVPAPADAAHALFTQTHVGPSDQAKIAARTWQQLRDGIRRG